MCNEIRQIRPGSRIPELFSAALLSAAFGISCSSWVAAQHPTGYKYAFDVVAPQSNPSAGQPSVGNTADPGVAPRLIAMHEYSASYESVPEGLLVVAKPISICTRDVPGRFVQIATEYREGKESYVGRMLAVLSIPIGLGLGWSAYSSLSENPRGAKGWTLAGLGAYFTVDGIVAAIHASRSDKVTREALPSEGDVKVPDALPTGRSMICESGSRSNLRRSIGLTATNEVGKTLFSAAVDSDETGKALFGWDVFNAWILEKGEPTDVYLTITVDDKVARRFEWSQISSISPLAATKAPDKAPNLPTAKVKAGGRGGCPGAGYELTRVRNSRFYKQRGNSSHYYTSGRPETSQYECDELAEVVSGARVSLTAEVEDGDNVKSTWWSQVAGPVVTLQNGSAVTSDSPMNERRKQTVSFVVPPVQKDELIVLSFSTRGLDDDVTEESTSAFLVKAIISLPMMPEADSLLRGGSARLPGQREDTEGGLGPLMSTWNKVLAEQREQAAKQLRAMVPGMSGVRTSLFQAKDTAAWAKFYRGRRWDAVVANPTIEAVSGYEAEFSNSRWAEVGGVGHTAAEIESLHDRASMAICHDGVASPDKMSATLGIPIPKADDRGTLGLNPAIELDFERMITMFKAERQVVTLCAKRAGILVPPPVNARPGKPSATSSASADRRLKPYLESLAGIDLRMAAARVRRKEAIEKHCWSKCVGASETNCFYGMTNQGSPSGYASDRCHVLAYQTYGSCINRCISASVAKEGVE